MESAEAGLVAEFVMESQEGLANIEQQMLAIEAGGSEVDLELVNSVFRTMHTIKGTSGFLGLDRVGTLAHSLEEVLDDMRNREITTSSELVTTILKAADFMKGLIDSVETSNEADISEHIASLQRFRAGAEQTTPGNSNPAEATNQPPTTPVATQADVSLSDAVREFLLECTENLDLMDQQLLELEQDPSSAPLIRSIFRTMHTIKGGAGYLGLGALERLAHTAENLLSNLRSGQQSLTKEHVRALLLTVDKCREGLQLVESRGNDVGLNPEPVIQLLTGNPLADEVVQPGTPTAGNEKLPRLGEMLFNQGSISEHELKAVLTRQDQGDSRRFGEILVDTGVAKSDDVVSALKTQENARTSSPPEGNIRVDVGLLDKLMTRVGELVLARNQILQRTIGMNDAEFISTAQRLNLITTELQESVMKTRMQPIGNVWSKFPRVVRDLSSQLGKQVRIEMEGKETELDKTIVEAIKDPLTHLVRNSVDHGIETPETRRAAGKPEEGRLLLRAYHEGGQVNIEIKDDGAGLNIGRIRAKAVERGLVSADQASRMSEREAAQLILLPGFSTAEKVTSVSGRGVGMDVVKTNIERIGGTIDLQTRAGQGTTIKIKIPLTLAIIPALIVTTCGERYAIPQVSLLELVRLEGAEVQRGIEYVHGAPVHRLRGKLLPLVNLSEQLQLAPSDAGTKLIASEEAVNIVVLRANDRQYGLVVDKVNDTEEIVVKPLSRQLKGLGEYAGTTIMGDGTVALILDVLGLAIASGLAAELPEQTLAGCGGDTTQQGQPTQALLVVDLGDSRRFALPTSMVARLEKVSSTSIEFANGREVIQYRGAILPLVRLSDVFGAAESSGPPPQDLQIIVYAEENHHCGFVVDRIVDIVETEYRPAAEQDQNGQLLGTAIIQQRVTDLLNLRTLARCDTRRVADKLFSSGSQR